jgi:ubiquinone/menaquinone biosynthesis C-methylase UbiE
MRAVNRRLNFDPLARPYRWLEYVAFGRALESCRFHFLPELTQARQALIFGDGDGRFLAKLLAANPALKADVVDISPAMLKRLQERLAPEARRRITVHLIDARQFALNDNVYDLVVTHFFLDCLTTNEVAALTERLAPSLKPNAVWVISEFAVPPGRVAASVGKAVISMLYRAFGWITGLPVRILPNYAGVMQVAGFSILEENAWLHGLLVSQRWRYAAAAARQLVTEYQPPTKQ